MQIMFKSINKKVMVKEVEVKVFEERLYCDKCGTEMEYAGHVLCSYPPKYTHTCPSCDYHRLSTTKYPNISYKPVNE